MTEKELHHLARVELELAKFHRKRADMFHKELAAMRRKRFTVTSKKTVGEIIEKLKT